MMQPNFTNVRRQRTFRPAILTNPTNFEPLVLCNKHGIAEAVAPPVQNPMID